MTSVTQVPHPHDPSQPVRPHDPPQAPPAVGIGFMDAFMTRLPNAGGWPLARAFHAARS